MPNIRTCRPLVNSVGRSREIARRDRQMEQNKLYQLVQTAKQHEKGSRERRRAIDELIRELKRSPEFHRCRSIESGNHHPSLHAQVYEAAFQELSIYLYTNIEEYDPTKSSVMGWCCYLLYRRFIPNEYQKLQRSQSRTLNGDISSISDLENLEQPENTPDYGEILANYILSNPVFKEARVRGNPNATFAAIFQMRAVEEKSWKEISQSLGISVSTLSSFYSRNANELVPRLRDFFNDYH